MREFIVLANTLAVADSRLAAEMAALAEKMKLNVYRNTDGVFIGTADDNPLTSARRRLERAVLGATTIDLSAATAKMQGLEKATYGVYQSLKEALAAKSAALKTVSAGKMVTEEISAAEEEKDEPRKMPEQGEKAAAVVPSEVLSVPETPVTVSSEAPIAEPEAPIAEPEVPIAEQEPPIAEPEAPMIEPGVPMTEPEAPMTEPGSPDDEPGVSMASLKFRNFLQKYGQPAAISELPAIEEWDDVGEEAAVGRAEDASADDKK